MVRLSHTENTLNIKLNIFMNIARYTSLFIVIINNAFSTSPDAQISPPAVAVPETAPQAAEPQTKIIRTGLPRKLLKRQKDAHTNNLKKQELQAIALADKKAAEAKALENLVKDIEKQADMLRQIEKKSKETAAALAKKLSSIGAKNSLTR